MKVTIALLMVVTAHILFELTGATDLRFYKKFYFYDGNAPCLNALQEIDVINCIFAPPVFCGLKCGFNPLCTFFRILGTKCQLYQGQPPPGVSEDAEGLLGEAYSQGGAPPRDLALHATVSSIDQLASFLAPYSDLVNGVVCGRVDQYSCPCTKASTQPYITIDLGSPRDITSVVITPSFSYKTSSFKNIDIHIGNTGSYATDTLVAHRNSDSVAAYTPQTFSVDARGQYVSIHKTYSSGGSLCLCHVQVFGP